MAIQCPKCGSSHTQSIRAVLQSGTTYNNGAVTGMSMGTDGAGVFSGTTANTSQTHLAARFAEPKKPKKLEIIAGAVFSLATSPMLFSKDAGAFITLGIMAWWAWEIRAYMKRNKVYQENYPIWKNMQDYGYYCHGCGNAFPVKS